MIYSSNATNFVGANAELKRGIQRLNNRKITSDLGLRDIEWKHAPPLASHQGEIYEAIIRPVRKVLESMMDDRKLRFLTDEAFGTLLKEIECILNNRPLTRVGTDPEELQALTPSMLLTGSISSGLPTEFSLLQMVCARLGAHTSFRLMNFGDDGVWSTYPSYSVVKNGCVLSATTRLVIWFSN